MGSASLGGDRLTEALGGVEPGSDTGAASSACRPPPEELGGDDAAAWPADAHELGGGAGAVDGSLPHHRFHSGRASDLLRATMV